MTNSPASNSKPPASSSFERLHPKLQRWIWENGWSELRDAQEQAIPIILSGERDLIIAAATASGKTEAAFLPILTRLLNEDARSSVIYISPLKALINDQFGRLEALCERLDIPLVPWHGDVSDSRKQRFLKQAEGVLLITPESLEALLMNRGHGLAGIFAGLRFIVVDELHAFIGTERGKQLQSLMHRIDTAIGRAPPRIGLSATLGDMDLAAQFLRFRGKVELAIGREARQDLQLVVKGYVNQAPKLAKIASDAETETEQETESSVVERAIAGHLYQTLRGANHLIFPNRRREVENYAARLRGLSEQAGVPNEFWPHHGNLSKDLREQTEAALKNKERPATAICTTTLELGIDIGTVQSVAQIGPAPSVASLRQRLGRSGRRGEPAILRCYIEEPAITPQTPLADQLRQQLLLTVAQIRLLLAAWCEPPRPHGLHLSTLIQQLLSLLAQYGGMNAQDAWRLLCADGPFAGLTPAEFKQLLRELASQNAIVQDSDSGLLLHGELGERVTAHYSFYAAFAADDEYRLLCGREQLGSLPVSRPLAAGSHVIFGGRHWRVLSVDPQQKIISVAADRGGRAPDFDGLGGKVHDRVRQEMRTVLLEQQPVAFLDRRAAELLDEARAAFRRFGLEQNAVLASGDELHVFFWKGDWVQDTVALMLRTRGLDALNGGLFVSVRGVKAENWPGLLDELARNPPSEAELMQKVSNLQQGKWDFLLPPALLARNYASLNLDWTGAVAALKSMNAD